MTGHIVSNHFLLNIKLHQIKWFVKGANAENYKAVLNQTIDENNAWYDKIADELLDEGELPPSTMKEYSDRKSTRLNSSHVSISYAVFCLKKKSKSEQSSRD